MALEDEDRLAEVGEPVEQADQLLDVGQVRPVIDSLRAPDAVELVQGVHGRRTYLADV
ncbi:hypothetical protein [Actinomadura miaoliensis]|uniref:hypothetical protein n=1 Tax=Actinomadura miaoliensis TaxID=430685 RepID=UPI0031EBC833